MFTSDVEQRKQRSQNNSKNEHNSDKTKKNFTGSYTEVNPIFLYFILSSFLLHTVFLYQVNCISLLQRNPRGGWGLGVLLGILGRGVPPGSPNPDPISDQNIPFTYYIGGYAPGSETNRKLVMTLL